MKLAEALMWRTEMQTKLTSLRSRIGANAVVQEGDQPQEDPQQLIREADRLLQERQTLVDRINATNQQAKLADGRTVAQAVAERERLMKLHGVISDAARNARSHVDRYSLSEIKRVPVLDVKQLEDQLDDLSSRIRQTNAAIQQINWSVDLS